MNGLSVAQTIKIHTDDGNTHVFSISHIDSITITPMETGTVSDIDGNLYRTVKIGEQWWMAENLKTTRYANGDSITHVTDQAEWSNPGSGSGAWCVYNNQDSLKETYGLLYNWYAVDDSRNIAPIGWHIPTDEEWKELEMYLGMSRSEADASGLRGTRGTDEGGKLKAMGTDYWNSPNLGATNSSGFSALPGGYLKLYGPFQGMNSYSYFWSATGENTDLAWYRVLEYDASHITRSYSYKVQGFSVRCVKD